MAIVVRPGHQDVQRVANQQLGLGVDARGRLVEDENPRVERQRPREREELLLPDRQRRAALGDRALVSERHPFDEAVGVHRRRRTPDIVIADRRVAKANVVGNRSGEQVDVLQHQAEQPAQLVERQLADVDAVDENPPAADVVEAQQQVDQRRLAGARGADDADALAGPDLERHVLENVVRRRCRRTRRGRRRCGRGRLRGSGLGARGSGCSDRVERLGRARAAMLCRAPSPESRAPTQSRSA